MVVADLGEAVQHILKRVNLCSNTQFPKLAHPALLKESRMRGRTLSPLAALAVLASPLMSQKPATHAAPAAAGIDIRSRGRPS